MRRNVVGWVGRGERSDRGVGQDLEVRKGLPTDDCTDTATDFTDLLRARAEWRFATSREMI